MSAARPKTGSALRRNEPRGRETAADGGEPDCQAATSRLWPGSSTGDYTGGAIARRFARESYITCVTRRTADKLEPLGAQIKA